MARRPKRRRSSFKLPMFLALIIGAGYFYNDYTGINPIDRVIYFLMNETTQGASLVIMGALGLFALYVLFRLIKFVRNLFRPKVPHADRIFSDKAAVKKSRHGWLYVLKNPSMQGVYKVGYTSVDPDTRAKQLSTTGVAQPFSVHWAEEMKHAEKIERQTHRLLDQYRVQKNREFFKTSPETIIRAISQAKSHVNQIAKER